MNWAPDPSDLFPDFSPVPQMVFVNERVSFQTEGNQRVIPPKAQKSGQVSEVLCQEICR